MKTDNPKPEATKAQADTRSAKRLVGAVKQVWCRVAHINHHKLQTRGYVDVLIFGCTYCGRKHEKNM